MITRTAPAPCPRCRGSRRTIELLRGYQILPPIYGLGFRQRDCDACEGLGVADPDDAGLPRFGFLPGDEEETSRKWTLATNGT